MNSAVGRENSVTSPLPRSFSSGSEETDGVKLDEEFFPVGNSTPVKQSLEFPAVSQDDSGLGSSLMMSPASAVRMRQSVITDNGDVFSGFLEALASDDEPALDPFVGVLEKFNFDAWMARPVSEKSMVPRRKIMKLLNRVYGIDLDLSSFGPAKFALFRGDINDLNEPQGVKSALLLFFSHTANFNPLGRQGRDFHSVLNASQKDEYHRTGKTGQREAVEGYIAKNGSEFKIQNKPAGHAVVPVNSGIFTLAKSKGDLCVSDKAAQINGQGLAVFKMTQGGVVGSMGMRSNSLNAARHLFGSSEDLVTIGVDRLRTFQIFVESLKFPSSEGYRDVFLRSRNSLVKNLETLLPRNVIQTGGRHPNLVMVGVGDVTLFKDNFNSAAKALGLELQVVNRGSFGFHFPSVSDVDGSLRLSPGLVPGPVLIRILNQQLNMGISDDAFSQYLAKLLENKRFPLYLEALKGMVKYVSLVLELFNKVGSQMSDDLLAWIQERLQNNLVKSNYLFSKYGEYMGDVRKMERHYLKTALVIENLKQYADLLVAGFSLPFQSSVFNDAFREKVLPSNLKFEVSLLDSGMQALGLGAMVAREYFAKKREGAVSVLDIFPYFEFKAIRKAVKLSQFRYTMSKPPVEVVVIDISPVLTDAKQSYKAFDQAVAKFKSYDKRDDAIVILDMTNSTLDDVGKWVKELKLRNFIVVESLSKYHQGGNDQFTLGRMARVGDDAFLGVLKSEVSEVEGFAKSAALTSMSGIMDEVFYGHS